MAAESTPRRTVLVTGASSGIGRATALHLARAGDHLVLLSRSARSLDDVATECMAAGAAGAVTVAADVGDDAAVRAAVNHAVGECGRLDAVVHAAGVVAFGRIEDVPTEVFDAVHRTNVLGTANLARHVLPVMRGQESGVLVVVGSLLGSVAVPGMGAYATSKWAVRALARHLQIETRDAPGVHVCLVTPGSVDTPIYHQGANYLGVEGRPPPPVLAPETVARTIAGMLDRPRRHRQAGPANALITAGFTVVPRLYDALVGPLYRWLGTGEPVMPTPGNVLEPQTDEEATHEQLR